MMNQEQLDAIKERVAKATQGPWKVAYDTDDRDHVVDIWFNSEENGHAEIHDNSFGNAPDNARFISHAREDVPALVAEVEELKESLERTEKCYEIMEKAMFKAVDKMSCFKEALEKVLEVEAPIMEGWETPAYKIAREALGGEAK